MIEKEMAHTQRQGVIIGAGISGLATGLFAQLQGLQLPIYERSQHLSSDNHLIWLAPNGSKMLKILGIFEEVLSTSVAQESMSFNRRDLSMVNQLRGAKLKQKGCVSILAIKRADFHRIMLQAFEDRGGVIKFGHKLDNFSVFKNLVKLQMSNQNTILAPYLVAADGIGSAIRRHQFSGSFVEYQGIRTWLGSSPSEHASNFYGRTLEVWGCATRFVFTSIDGQNIHWSALERSKAYVPNHKPIPADTKQRLQHLFKDYHPVIKDCLANMDTTKLKRCNFGVVKGLREYHSGKICLVGDAAHGMPPNMGQGASLGLEDGLWIADRLGRTPTHQVDFSGYFTQRAGKVGQATRIANAMNTLFQPKSLFASKVRDLAYRALPTELNESAALALYQKPVLAESNQNSRWQRLAFKIFTKIAGLWLRKVNSEYTFDIMKPEDCKQASEILAQEFFSREPLCLALKVPLEDITPFFREMTAVITSQKLGFVIRDTNRRVVACMVAEDHKTPFQPDTHTPSQKLRWIHAILDREHPDRAFDILSAGVVFHAGLVAIRHDLGKNKVLPWLLMEVGKNLYNRGYRAGYAKISNPKIIKTLAKLERPLRYPFFKLRGKTWPKNETIDGKKPFLHYSFPICIYSWRLLPFG